MVIVAAVLLHRWAKNSFVVKATVDQSSLRQRRLIERHLRSMSTKSRRLSHAGWWLRAVVVGIMVDVWCRRVFVGLGGWGMRGARRGQRECEDMRRLNCGEECDTNLLGYFTEDWRFLTPRGTHHLWAKRASPLLQKMIINRRMYGSRWKDEVKVRGK